MLRPSGFCTTGTQRETGQLNFAGENSYKSSLIRSLNRRLLAFQVSRNGGGAKVAGSDLSATHGAQYRWTRAQLAVAWGLCFVLLALFFGTRPPDVNETHYLTKAKHFWNPDWCPGDLFLGSSYSHWLFYASTGWVTRWVSLDTYAWIGRLACWAGFAWAWMRLTSRWLLNLPLTVFSLGLFVILVERFNMAGEWTVGGFEAKSIAWVMAFMAIDGFLRRAPDRVLVFTGLSIAFHVLVGGWTLLAILGAASVDLIRQVRLQGRDFAWDQIAWPSRHAIAAFALLAAAGVIPPIVYELDSPAEIRHQAHQIYVHVRLRHHLLFGDFETYKVARFAVLILLWRAMSWAGRRTAGMEALDRFAVSSLAIAFVGVLLSAHAELNPESLATDLLRFYWFRLADVAVPLVTSVAVTLALAYLWFESPRWSGQHIAACVGFGLIPLAACAMILETHRDPRPRADRVSLPTYQEAPRRTIETWKNWCRVCTWIQDRTADDALFLTPNEQQTFKWYAGRTEVVNWKDMPQSGPDTLEWKRRIDLFYVPQKYMPETWWRMEQVRQAVDFYEVDYLVLMQASLGDAPIPNEWKLVYPQSRQQQTTYVVLERIRPAP